MQTPFIKSIVSALFAFVIVFFRQQNLIKGLMWLLTVSKGHIGLALAFNLYYKCLLKGDSAITSSSFINLPTVFKSFYTWEVPWNARQRERNATCKLIRQLLNVIILLGFCGFRCKWLRALRVCHRACVAFHWHTSLGGYFTWNSALVLNDTLVFSVIPFCIYILHVYSGAINENQISPPVSHRELRFAVYMRHRE